MKAFVVNLLSQNTSVQPEAHTPSVKVFHNQATAQAECGRLNREESGMRYQVSEVEFVLSGFLSYAASCAEAEAADNRAFEASIAAFLTGAQILFEAHPDLDSFGWKQYTPWSVCDTCSNNLVICDAPDINEIDGFEIVVRSDDEPSWEAEVQHEVAVFLKHFREDHLLRCFGLNRSITCYRDGTFETEELDEGEEFDGYYTDDE
jgi:hypothetical protein